MNFQKNSLIISFFIFIASCGPQLPDAYHMEKKFWNTEDYITAIRHIKYNLNEEEGYPRLSNPLTAPVFKKLVDKQNVSIVLKDEELGVKYRNEVSKKFFDISQDLLKVYQDMDIQDKFIYPVELVQIIDFGLHTQIQYFRLGNEEIKKNAINPSGTATLKVIKENEQTIVNNFNIYIEFLAKEEAFSEEARKEYAEVINVQFNKLMDEFPAANYSKMKNNANLLLKNMNSPELKTALEKLVLKIEQM